MSKCINQTDLSYWINVFISLSPIFITLVIGVVAAYIAYQQYNVNRNKFRFELFETRLNSYQNLLAFFSEIVKSGAMNASYLYLLRDVMKDSEFLFGSDVSDYLREIESKSLIMLKLNPKIYGKGGLPIGDARNLACEESNEILNWFGAQLQYAHNKYKPYLHLGEKY